VTLFVIVKYLHVLLAILAVGFNASYAIWLARAAREPDHTLHVLRGIKFLDDRVANPAYVLLLISGLAMVGLTQIPLSTFWIAAALVLYVVLVAVGLGLYTPALRSQIKVLETQGAASEQYQRLAQRGTVVGAVLGVDALAIVFLMVTKPTL
jgi:uncharacterized membrane protein